MRIRSALQPAAYIRAAVQLAAVLVIAGLFACSSSAGTPASAVQVPAGSVSATQGTIRAWDLPQEARETLHLIKNGGPFPYSKDGSVFGNYEGLLPHEPSGYYHEYTVLTPGSKDRGARRIIAGSGGEYYYTSDHYASFKLIKE